VQAEEILIGCFVECQSIKKVGGRRSVEELYQALFSFRPSRLNVSPSETKIEPDRRLVRKEKIYSYCLIKIIEAKLSFQRETCLGKKFSFIYSENCKMFKNKITEKKGQNIKSDMEKSLFVVHYFAML